MKSCSKFRSLLPLFSGGELSEAESRRVEGHLSGCETCRTEEAEFSQVIELTRIAGTQENCLPETTRRRIVQEAAGRASRAPWGLPVPMFSLSAHPGVLAGAAAVLLALVALPVAMRQGFGPARQSEVSSLEITSDGGVVRLAWSDGSREAYRVYKSSDPRKLGRGEVHVVRGNIWTDSKPASSPIVYYMIE